jgi:hypothetical protein
MPVGLAVLKRGFKLVDIRYLAREPAARRPAAFIAPLQPFQKSSVPR